MDELAYQKVITQARIQFARERLDGDVSRIRKGNIFLSGSWFSALMKMVNYSDLFVIGISLWRRIAPLFSRKKRQ